jgi:hypothetical protein
MELKNIIVPLDGSTLAEASIPAVCVEEALRLAGRLECATQHTVC